MHFKKLRSKELGFVVDYKSMKTLKGSVGAPRSNNT